MREALRVAAALWLVVACGATVAQPTDSESTPVATDPATGLEALDAIFGKSTTFRVRPDETAAGDRYRIANTVEIEGRIDGDFFGFAPQSLNVSGEVDGDLAAWANVAVIGGRVRDSVRIAGSQVNITGEIDGDLLVFAATTTISPSAVIRGNAHVFGQRLTVNGRVDGGVRAVGGEVVVSGEIGGAARIRCDLLTLEPDASIGGDLAYRARKEASVPEGMVGGEVSYEPRAEKSEEKTEKSLFERLGWRLWRVGATLVAGFLLVALLRGPMTETAIAVGREPMKSAGVGLVVFVVLPVAAVISMLAIVTIPIAAISLLLYGALVYLAKVPVALWIGRRLMAWLGRVDPSPFLALTLGVPVLYVILALPYFVGTIAWFVATLAGLGAVVLGGVSWSERFEEAE